VRHDCPACAAKNRPKKQRTKSILTCMVCKTTINKCSCHLLQEATYNRTETILPVIKNNIISATCKTATSLLTRYCSLPGIPDDHTCYSIYRMSQALGLYKISDHDMIVRSDGCFLHYFLYSYLVLVL